ncbi:hypothetical protein ACLQ2P_34825 [Actinomadura citrea]|uniref:hypothetical protein n=1 Tax=Actinomadura TaxID=1988 RepID=UPI002E2A48C9|nr:hypothetical protein [Actinomadura citrea]
MSDTHNAAMWNNGVNMTQSSDPEVRTAGFELLGQAKNDTDGSHPGGAKPEGTTSQS